MMNQEQLIHYSDYPGREPTYVFVHGFTCNETDFVNQVEHFRGIGHRVITLDLPGHGLSRDYIPKDLTMKAMGRHVVTLLRHLEVKEAIMIGHSMGCMVVTEVALQAPDVVIGIVLIDGSRIARGDPEEAVATRRKVFEDEGFKKFMMNTFEPMFLPGSDETEKKRIIDRACTQPEHASIDILLSAVRWCAEEFEPAYMELDVPVQVIQSTHRGETCRRIPVTSDTVIEWHGELEDCGVNAEFDLVPDCGHFTMLDKPEVVNASIERLHERTKDVAKLTVIQSSD